MTKTSLSTHVLDTTTGRPAAGIRVSVEQDGRVVASGVTDADGRIPALASGLDAGAYRLVFETGAYAGDLFFRRVALDVALPDGHTHVPLLLSRFGVTSYRGS